MMERPILMSAPMVRAILEGRKTQTRRVVKPRKDMGFGCPLAPNEIAGEINNGDYTNSVYGAPGDRLWIRENFQPLMADDVREEDWLSCDYKTGKGYKVSYPATDGVKEYYDIGSDNAFCDRVTPSIHMPRWASRINLEITAVRVKLLQDISEQDARSEGAESADYATGRKCILEPDKGSYRLHYRSIWEQINGAGSWDANPWVWVVEFKRVSP